MDNSSSNEIVNYLCNRYYALVEHLEALEEKHKVRMDFANCLQDLSLGEVVDINDGLYDNYVITRMHGTFSYSEAADGINSHDTSFHKAEGVPVLTNRPDEKGVVNPIVDDLPRVVVPPKARSASGTESDYRVGTSTGCGVSNDTVKLPTGLLEGRVTDNADPMKMNRVKVRYTFQNVESTSDSPWIPVMVPFSGTDDGGGFTMTLEKNERVLIWIENNNPTYVMGSIYVDKKDVGKNLPDLGYKDNVPATYKVGRKIRTIASGNGHALTFLDKPDSSLLFSKLPVFKTVLSCMRLHGKDNWMTKAGNVKGGGVILSDGSCLCTVELNADKQAIDIHSDFGTVNISAFTGITVNAPNGDITIKGKNVSIEAGNNLSLKAGTNIRRKNIDMLNSLGLGVGTALTGMLTSALSSLYGVDLSNLFDVSYLRNIYEIFMRPVEGSLSIKSNRNVLVMAGEGEVSIPTDYMSSVYRMSGDLKFRKHKDIYDSDLSAYLNALQNCINDVGQFVDSLSAKKLTLLEKSGSILFRFSCVRENKRVVDSMAIMQATLFAMEEQPKSIDTFIKEEYLDDLECKRWYTRYKSQHKEYCFALKDYEEDVTDLKSLKESIGKYDKYGISVDWDTIPGDCKKFTQHGNPQTYEQLVALKNDVDLAAVRALLKKAVMVSILKSTDFVKVLAYGGDPGVPGHSVVGTLEQYNNKEYDYFNKNGLDAFIAGDNTHTWQSLCNALVVEKSGGKLDSFNALPFLPGLVGGLTGAFGAGNYDSASGKWNPMPSVLKLVNAYGSAGPRGFDDMSATKGNILMSNNSKVTLGLAADTTGWNPHNNSADSKRLQAKVTSLNLG